jgi:DnaJ like chaperone protein
MSIWTRFAELLGSVAASAGDALNGVFEAVRTVFEGDPATRRRVAFSVAMIALSAKMAKADGVVTAPEVTAFHQIFEVPEADRVFVERLHGLARQDVAGYQAYARKIADVTSDDPQGGALLEDILDGLFHIAKADGVVHERELGFLAEVADIFGLTPERFESLLARHLEGGRSDPHAVLGIARSATLAEARQAWITLVKENHPDLAAARGMPDEFAAISNARLAAINAAWEAVEREKLAA